jgi:LPXTG-site transpeptidase (sortase) family protein
LNPLFDSTDQDGAAKPQNAGYVLAHHKGKQIQPPGTESRTDKNAAIALIRGKLDAIYQDEPDTRLEAKEAAAAPAGSRSRHQQFMFDLSNSGKSLAEIQTAWHAYYAELDDQAKHEVWREFYENNGKPRTGTAFQKASAAHQLKGAHTSAAKRPQAPQMPLGLLHPVSDEDAHPKVIVSEHYAPVAHKTAPGGQGQAHGRGRNLTRLHRRVLTKVQLSAAQQEKARQHFHSLLFGIGTGVTVLLIFLFSFFNEMIIAPFIQPSRTVSSTPIILSGDSIAASETPEVIIPKINVQIPIVYDERSVDEDAIQRALERGVIHYASTSLPGEQGNTAIFGHSSNNIFNKGKYKFAFVKLNDLVPGDTFYLTRDKKVYAYRVYDKRVVEPNQTEVLRPVGGKIATATLITCDPPGTSKHRLVVWGEQISPDPSGASVATATSADPEAVPTQLASEGPTLWRRFMNWLF